MYDYRQHLERWGAAQIVGDVRPPTISSPGGNRLLL